MKSPIPENYYFFDDVSYIISQDGKYIPINLSIHFKSDKKHIDVIYNKLRNDLKAMENNQ